jgi:hypothetical protein
MKSLYRSTTQVWTILYRTRIQVWIVRFSYQTAGPHLKKRLRSIGTNYLQKRSYDPHQRTCFPYRKGQLAHLLPSARWTVEVLIWINRIDEDFWMVFYWMSTMSQRCLERVKAWSLAILILHSCAPHGNRNLGVVVGIHPGKDGKISMSGTVSNSTPRRSIHSWKSLPVVKTYYSTKLLVYEKKLNVV